MGQTVFKQELLKPANPPTGYNSFYAKTDGKFYQLNDLGVESEIGSGSGGLDSQEVRLNFLGDLDAPQTGTAKWSPFSQITILYAYFTFATPSTAQAQAVVKKNDVALCTLTATANNYKSNNFTANAGEFLIGAIDYLTVDLTSVQAAKNFTLTIGYKKWQ